MDVWDEPEPEPELVPGKIDMVAPAPATYDDFAAVLWLPDVEQRRGWREFYVRRVPERKPGARPRGMGFG